MTMFRVHGGGGGEDVSEEVAVQTPLIQQIREMVVGKATDANATEDTIVKGYSAYVGQKLVNGGYIADGTYIWREFTEKDGIFIKNVSSDDELAYPDRGEQDGFWYEKVVEGVAGIDTGTITLSSSKTSITVEHGLGVVPKCVILLPEGTSYSYNNSYTYMIIQYKDKILTSTYSDIYGYFSGGGMEGSISYSEQWATMNKASITFKRYSDSYNFAPITYRWIAIA